jgi:hypothetical protein
MFRIPRKNPKGTILLQHPLSVNSRIYVSRRNESLGNNFETVFSVIIPRVVKDCRIFLWWYHEWSFAL